VKLPLNRTASISDHSDTLRLGAQEMDRHWTGSLVAFDTSTPFADSFSLERAGGPSNYTGVSQSAGPKSFVWRGYMSGVDCE
jgi:hypothetical protein